jgi:Uri superfamily endonuclease
MIVITNNYDALPAISGAYVLLFNMAEESRLEIGKFQGAVIKPGHYAYAGSARGPGGIRARCRRHLSKNKKLHWHIDHLTNAAQGIQVAAYPNGNECALAAKILKAGNCDMPLAGFGSSDCRTCKSHLIKLPHNWKSQILPLITVT